jgi:hypothetical protein
MTLIPQPRVHWFSPISRHILRRPTPIKNLRWLIKNMQYVEVARIVENIYLPVGQGGTLTVSGNRNDEVFYVSFYFEDITVLRDWVSKRKHLQYVGVEDTLA